jgi:hypothetical protein
MKDCEMKQSELVEAVQMSLRIRRGIRWVLKGCVSRKTMIEIGVKMSHGIEIVASMKGLLHSNSQETFFNEIPDEVGGDGKGR